MWSPDDLVPTTGCGDGAPSPELRAAFRATKERTSSLNQNGSEAFFRTKRQARHDGTMLSLLVVGPVPSRLRGERVSWESGGGVVHPISVKTPTAGCEMNAVDGRKVELHTQRLGGSVTRMSIDTKLCWGSDHSKNSRFVASLLIGLVMPCQKLYSMVCCRLWRNVLLLCLRLSANSSLT